MRKISNVVLSLSVILLLYGCAAVLIGTGVAGGIAISEDTVKLEKSTSVAHAYAVTYSTLERMGVIILENKYAGRIEAEVQNSKVTAQIESLTPKTIRIKITARKDFNLIPNIDLAMEIINRINNRL